MYWQKVLHGGCLEVRAAVVRVLATEKNHKACFRYACCGLGDQLTKRGEEVFVSPMGCGHKLCPRCGRRRGGKYAKRILGWLAKRPHGDVWSVVLTQRVVSGESLKGARARMAPKQKRYMRWLTRRGMVAGMTTVHMVWSERSSGWHYHVHVMADMGGTEIAHRELLEQWVIEGKGERVRVADEQAKLVVKRGGPITELADDAGDLDFWHESKGPVARAVQYPLRDLVQGVSATRLGGAVEQVDACARELVRDAAGWKCFRAWGDWRKACPVEKEEEDEGEGDGEDGAAAPAAATPLGTVPRVWREAREGQEAAREAMRALERSVCNESDFAKRLVGFCRSCLGRTVLCEKG